MSGREQVVAQAARALTGRLAGARCSASGRTGPGASASTRMGLDAIVGGNIPLARTAVRTHLRARTVVVRERHAPEEGSGSAPPARRFVT
ncbi:hypothetical protein [Streptomyces longisporus]|uniref:Uncharacterized protein n=1 Tax=Streptomyces longisporus TaxID=1948 RepID=A0ABN3L3D9_STRLO